MIEAVFSIKLVDDKRLRVDIASIREFLKINDIRQIKWCAGDGQLANCMTKQGASGYELLKILQCGKMPDEFSNKYSSYKTKESNTNVKVYLRDITQHLLNKITLLPPLL